MPLTPGTRLGAYEITAPLGSGGMGEVYRARDTKLNRDVALKVLPEQFALDTERLARFKREAQVLASLNHQNIAAIHGFEESSGVQALVLEFVEGPTLAEVIARAVTESSRLPQAQGRGVPINEALPIARQIAEALEAAHEHGIVHRDLKPANIKLRADGVVKVLDFGLAKALDPLTRPSASLSPDGGEGWGEGASQSPTITSPAMATHAGVILGTAAYMSPEQARGNAVDKRADIWAFGCVVYEMLTGKRAFAGDGVSDTLAAILRGDPDWSAVPATTPAPIQRLLRHCLAKDPRERLRDIGDARFEIVAPLPAPSSEPVPSAARRFAGWRGTAALALVVLVVGGVAGAAVWLATRSDPPRVTRLPIAFPSTQALAVSGINRDVAISPDGSRVVYVGGNGSQLFARAMDQLDASRLVDSGGPADVFMSPDGQWVGFVDRRTTLKKVAITGGPPVTICRLIASRGATWGPDNTIIFATVDPSSGLLRVSAAGGELTVLTRPNRDGGERDHFWPQVLPNGEAVLFTIVPNGSIENAQVAVLDLKTGQHKILMRGGADAHYVPSGHLVYAVGTTLQAVAFDLNRLEIVGTPIPVVQQVTVLADGAAEFDVARDGTLVYVPGGTQAVARTLTWVDRQGREDPIKAPAQVYGYPRLSPDGRRLAIDSRDQGADIWIWDFARETLTRFTFDPAVDLYAHWTPDGRRLVFESQRMGSLNLFWQAADGTGSAERLIESQNPQYPSSISPDGTVVVFREDGATSDVMMIELTKERRVRPLVQTNFNELNGEISPDGRRLAYQSDESGRDEIYVRPFPDVAGGRWQISNGGGTKPLWARNGRELFYVSQTGALMSVAVEQGATFTAGTPVKLFEARNFLVLGTGAVPGRTYDISPDGQRFLMIKSGGGSEGDAAVASIIVVQNWFEELKRLVPTR